MISKIRLRVDSARDRWRGWLQSAIGGVPVRVHPEDRSFWIDTNFRAWEEETLDRVKAAVRPGVRFCDIGAWVGPISIFAAQLGAEVTCFEPDPVAYERLLFNLRLNGRGRVTPFNIALGAADGIRRLAPLAKELGQSGSSFYASDEKTGSVKVPTLSWTSAVRLLDLPAFEVVKIDVEGAEAELLPAMMPWLRETRPDLLLATHWRFMRPEHRKNFMTVLDDLAGIYPGATVPDMDVVQNGFPSLHYSIRN